MKLMNKTKCFYIVRQTAPSLSEKHTAPKRLSPAAAAWSLHIDRMLTPEQCYSYTYLSRSTVSELNCEELSKELASPQEAE